MSVRARLTLGVAVLLIAVFAAMGIVMARETESTMISRVDQDVKAESARITKPNKDKDNKGGPDDQDNDHSGQSPTPDPSPQATGSSSGYGDTKRSFCTRIYDSSGTIQAQWLSGYQDDPDPPPSLPPFGSEEFERMLGTIVTRPSEDGSLEYRVLIQPGRVAGDVVVTAAPLREVHEAVSQVIRRFMAIGFAGLFVAAAASWWVIRREFQPVDKMINTAAAIAGGDLSRRVPEDNPATELGRLGRALNEMLGQIEEGHKQRDRNEQRLRRFVADAAHELRTPLTSVRGYSELYRQGAYPDQPSVDAAMARIESEGGRMARLVDDLLLLARLDQQRGIEQRPVDLVSLANEAATDFAAVSADHPLEWEPEGEVVVRGDRLRLRQVIDNLLNNARLHTPAGTKIRLAVARNGTGAEVTIADEGPGIPPDAQEHIFERFWRADSSRHRNTGGTGLGLAIVQSLVNAHGGSVTLESEPGHGARFTINLPLLTASS
jgi:two-component system OmpR family sensor kinase